MLYILVLNNTPFVHAHGYLQYLNSALPGNLRGHGDEIHGIECLRQDFIEFGHALAHNITS